ncbi:MAG TPA: hypothetical protein VMT03_17745 [Polyangia bacterium]|nr:hypothetical protein [Polyangia bacterium]
MALLARPASPHGWDTFNTGISFQPPAVVDSMHAYADNFNGLTTDTWLVPGPTSGGAGLAQQSPSIPPETRLVLPPTFVRLLVHNLGTPASGCSTTFAVSKNGSAIAATDLAVTNATSNNTFQDSGLIAVSSSTTDSWGVKLASAPSMGSSCNFAVYVTAYFYGSHTS